MGTWAHTNKIIGDIPDFIVLVVPSFQPRHNTANHFLIALKKKNFHGRDTKLCFVLQVETRDNEIDRLSRMLEGGRPYDVVALETRNRSNERLISHLNIQVSDSIIVCIC